MSTGSYGIDEYGLVLDTVHLRFLALAMHECTEEEWKNDKWSVIENLSYQFFLCSESCFTGEACAIRDNGETDWGNAVSYGGDPIFYVPVSNYPMLFKRAYESMDELVCEFKRRIGEYLPDSFDYRNNIRHIVGVYYG